MQLELVAQDAEQARIVPWLLNEIVGAATHGLDREIDVGVRRHHDDGDLGVALADGGEEVQAFETGGGVARVVEIEQNAVEPLQFKLIEYHGGRPRGGQEIAFGPEKELEGF